MALKEEQGRTGTRARLTVSFSVTDTPLGNPAFIGSDSGFLIGTNRVYPVIHSWGDFAKEMGGSTVDSATVTLSFLSDAIWAPTNGTTRKKVVDWFRELQLRDVGVGILQWSDLSLSGEFIWIGYVVGIENSRLQDGIPVLDVLLAASVRDLERIPISDLITKASFANCPDQSLGLMLPRAYGEVFNGLSGGGGGRNTRGMTGHTMQGIRGVVVDENVATAKSTIRFSKNDGTTAAKTFVENTAGDPITLGDLWVWDPAVGAYGMVDNSSMSFVNDVDKLDVTVDAAPKVFFYIVATLPGDTASAGFTDLYKLYNSNPDDFSLSTATENIWAFDIPTIAIQGRITAATVMVDWSNGHASESRRIRYGIWDKYRDSAPLTGPGYMNQIATDSSTRAAGSARVQESLVTGYTQFDFRDHTGSDTAAEFATGRFLTRDTGNTNEAALQLRAEVLDLGGADAGKEDVRLNHIVLIVTVTLPNLPKGNAGSWLGPGAADTYKGQRWKRFLEENNIGKRAIEARLDALSRSRGTDYFITGAYQSDDGSGTYGGSASQAIRRPQDIANHIIHKVAGKTRNVTASTLGNFVDPRTNGVLKDIQIVTPFGPDEVKAGEALDMLQDRFPMTVFEDDGVFQCIPDDINPHSSRLYRSTSDQVWIGPEDIVEGTFECPEHLSQDFVNSVVLKYGHGFPDREPSGTKTYTDPLSVMYFGKKDDKTFDEPMLTDASANGLTAMAEWLGRRSARPRLRPSCVLRQKFYDLRRGHIVQFKDLEEVGLQCRAFRCGLIDYYFTYSGSTTNLGNSTAPNFIQTGLAEALYVGLSQQTDHLDFWVSVAAAYTTVSNAWKYLDINQAWTNLTGVTNGDAIKATGKQRISFTRPTPTSWAKWEQPFGAFGSAGPCYWLKMDYTGGTVAGTGNARTSHDPNWFGRLFECLGVGRTPVGEGEYLGVSARFREVM